MAEMDTSSGGGHKKNGGVTKSKKASTRVDLTPMVDLGFLLITFFMFATTLSTPKAAKFRVPKDDVDEKDQMKASKAGAMHALIGPNKESIYYYEGDNPIAEGKKGMNLISIKDFRKRIMDLRTELKNQNIHDSVMILSIKPLKGAHYGTFLAVFDEVKINDIRTSVKVKPKDDEIKVIDAYNAANNVPLLPKEGYKPLPKGTVGIGTDEVVEEKSKGK
jgi:biopolymer transport protein ExbD